MESEFDRGLPAGSYHALFLGTFFLWLGIITIKLGILKKGVLYEPTGTCLAGFVLLSSHLPFKFISIGLACASDGLRSGCRNVSLEDGQSFLLLDGSSGRVQQRSVYSKLHAALASACVFRHGRSTKKSLEFEWNDQSRIFDRKFTDVNSRDVRLRPAWGLIAAPQQKHRSNPDPKKGTKPSRNCRQPAPSTTKPFFCRLPLNFCIRLFGKNLQK